MLRHSNVTRYDVLHARYGHFELHHQTAPGVARREIRYAGGLAMCILITAAELRFGAEKAGRANLTELVESFLERLAILDWTAEVTFHYATIRSAIERAGKPMGNLDLVIAAHAVSQGLTLVTNNMKHFSHVPKLNTEVWG